MPDPIKNAPFLKGAEDGVVEGGRVLDRHAATIPTFDVRWLVGIVIVVPLTLAAGVYWLHQLPAGSQSRSAGPVVEVRLIQAVVSDPDPVVAVRPDREISAGRSEPLIAAPERLIPEETTAIASAPTGTTSDPAIDQNSPPAVARPRQVPGGSASAFQRLLFNHIARYMRYPKGARPGSLHGVVHVRFAMRRDGTVTGAWVRASSGHLILDEAATETIRRAQPLPVIPADLPDTLTILLPVSFDAS